MKELLAAELANDPGNIGYAAIIAGAEGKAEEAGCLRVLGWADEIVPGSPGIPAVPGVPIDPDDANSALTEGTPAIPEVPETIRQVRTVSTLEGEARRLAVRAVAAQLIAIALNTERPDAKPVVRDRLPISEILAVLDVPETIKDIVGIRAQLNAVAHGEEVVTGDMLDAILSPFPKTLAAVHAVAETGHRTRMTELFGGAAHAYTKDILELVP